jgi:hypothetical protein
MDFQIKVTRAEPAKNLNLYRILTDMEIGRFDRPALPMVFAFSDGRVPLTREWQYFIRAINYGMSARHCSAIFHTGRAFANKMGFENPERPCRDYFKNENLDAPDLPILDKVRTCGDATIEMISGVVSMMDGTKAPPLKSGQMHPQTIQEAAGAFDRYLYTPKSHPWLFFAATTTKADFTLGNFPNGALYSWYRNGSTPATFLPHVAPAKIIYPPSKWTDNTPTIKKI